MYCLGWISQIRTGKILGVLTNGLNAFTAFLFITTLIGWHKCLFVCLFVVVKVALLGWLFHFGVIPRFTWMEMGKYPGSLPVMQRFRLGVLSQWLNYFASKVGSTKSMLVLILIWGSNNIFFHFIIYNFSTYKTSPVFLFNNLFLSDVSSIVTWKLLLKCVFLRSMAQTFLDFF